MSTQMSEEDWEHTLMVFVALCFTLFQAVPLQSGAWSGAFAPTCPFVAKGHAPKCPS